MGENIGCDHYETIIGTIKQNIESCLDTSFPAILKKFEENILNTSQIKYETCQKKLELKTNMYKL